MSSQPHVNTSHQTLSTCTQVKLKGENICMDPAVRGVYTRAHTLWDLYREVWLPFGKLLTDLEAEGMLVDRYVCLGG